MTPEDELDDVIVKALCVYYEYGTPLAEFKWMAMGVREAIKAAGWTLVRNDELMLMDMRAKTFEQWETD